MSHPHNKSRRPARPRRGTEMEESSLKLAVTVIRSTDVHDRLTIVERMLTAAFSSTPTDGPKDWAPQRAVFEFTTVAR